MMFLLEELQRRGVCPRRLVTSGLRIYVLEMGGQNARRVLSKDSLNYFGCALSALPKAFGLQGCAPKP